MRADCEKDHLWLSRCGAKATDLCKTAGHNWSTISSIFQPNIKAISLQCAEMGSPLSIIFTKPRPCCPGNAVSMDSRNHNPIFPTFLFYSNLQEWTQAFCIPGHYDVSTHGHYWHHELWPIDVPSVQLSNKATTNSVRCASCHGVLKLLKKTMPDHANGLWMLRSALIV